MHTVAGGQILVSRASQRPTMVTKGPQGNPSRFLTWSFGLNNSLAVLM